jgi:hypothetical protein
MGQTDPENKPFVVTVRRNTMEMIDRYVAEVARNLPEKSRPDIAREIRSLLEDALDDRSQAAGRAPDEEMAVALLKEFGDPAKVAASYLPPKYLIGPQLFPTFITVLKIVLTVMVVLILIQFGVALTQTSQGLAGFGQVMVELVADLTSGLVQVFGTIVLVFAIIQFTQPNLTIPSADWDPRKLKPADSYEKPVKTVDLAFEFVFTAIVIVLFNLYADRVGIYLFQDSEWRFVPMLTQAFFSFVPALTAMWVLTIVKDLWVIRDNRWTAATRWLAVGVTIFSIGITAAMLAGAPIMALTADAMASFEWMGMPAASAAALQNTFTLLVRLGLAIGLVGSVVELVKLLYEIMWKQRKALE